VISRIDKMDMVRVYDRDTVQWSGIIQYVQAKGKFYCEVKRKDKYFYFTCDTHEEITSVKITKSHDFDKVITMNNRKYILESL
jgi:hypothetical protein